LQNTKILQVTNDEWAKSYKINIKKVENGMENLYEKKKIQYLQGLHMKNGDFKKVLFLNFLWVAIRKMVC